MVVLEPRPHTFLVALFVRGFWLEVSTDGPHTRARFLYGEKVIALVHVGQA
jgi:hypothetical protein